MNPLVREVDRLRGELTTARAAFLQAMRERDDNAAEASRLRSAIEQHRDSVTSQMKQWTGDPASDRRLWDALDRWG